MKTRILSGLIMAPLLVLIFLGGYFLMAGAFVISLLALREFYTAFSCSDDAAGSHRPAAWAGYLSLVILYILFLIVIVIGHSIIGHSIAADTVASNTVSDIGLLTISPSTGLLSAWIFVTLLIGFIATLVQKMDVIRCLATLIGPLYIVFMASFVYLTDSYHNIPIETGLEWLKFSGFGGFVWVIMIGAFGTDIFAYFTGMTIGKHKLCPSISPKKTIEGSIGGVAGSMLLTFLYCHFLIPDMAVYDALLLGFVMGVVSQLGDLSASMLKRKLGVKDWGSLIPGHGGVLDRIDSVLFTAPAVYYYLQIREVLMNGMMF